MKTVGHRLRALRKDQGLTQLQLAEVLGVSHPAVSQKENNELNLSFKDVEKLSARFFVNANWLMTGEGEMYLPGKSASRVEESIVAYERRWDSSQVNIRFRDTANKFMALNHLSQREFSIRLHVNEQQLSNALNLHKDVTVSMLAAAHRHANFNMNYVLGGSGTMFNNEEQVKLEDILYELHELKKCIPEKKRA